MSEISIQQRRVTERVKQYLNMFGFNSFTVTRPGRSTIRANRRLGFDEIECVVAETARGTSVGFYPVNILHGLIYAVPFIFVLLIFLLDLIPAIHPALTGDTAIMGIDWLKLTTGIDVLSWPFVLMIIVFILYPVGVEYYVQQVRLGNLKSRFSFFTKDAVWESREISPITNTLLTIPAILVHLWLVSLVYFGGFAGNSTVISDLTTAYNTDLQHLMVSTTDAFVITMGTVVGLLAGYKTLRLVKDSARYDARNRIQGIHLERRLETMFISIQSAIITALFALVFLYNTYLSSASAGQLLNFMLFAVLGAVIAGYVHQEGDLWVGMSYVIIIFFSSLIFLFRTGSSPEFAFIVIVQLFLLPIPFILILSSGFGAVLKKYENNVNYWLFNVFPLSSFITIYEVRKRKQLAKELYEQGLHESVPEDIKRNRILVEKDILSNHDSYAYRLVRHYFELIFEYTASFDESAFVIIPDEQQLQSWWASKSNEKAMPVQQRFIRIADQLLWDATYLPSDDELSNDESIGRQMVLALR